MELNDEVHRGHKATELLENTLLQEALDAIEREVVEQWAECPARDKDGKEALWQLMKTAQKFRRILTGYVDTGKLASDTLKRFEEKKGIRDVLRRIA